MKKINNRQEAIVIATKYKNKKIIVDYYTKSGEPLSKDDIKKESDSKGVRFYYFE